MKLDEEKEMWRREIDVEVGGKNIYNDSRGAGGIGISVVEEERKRKKMGNDVGRCSLIIAYNL